MSLPTWNLDGLFCLSLNSTAGVPASLREDAALPSDEKLKAAVIDNWLSELREEFGPNASLVYLATCHRIEFYGYGFPTSKLKALWAELCGQRIFSAEEHNGLNAYEHLLRVTSSLASEVLGETQITGQVRRAFDESKNRTWLRGPLQRSFEEVLRVTKRIRHETKIGSGTISVAHVAVDGVEDVFTELQDKRILVVGAGQMAQQALERLMSKGAKHITWVNRSRERLLKHPLSGFCEIGDFSHLNTLVWEHSVSVFATSAQSTLLIRDKVTTRKEFADRKVDSPRVLLDLGLPRNVDERLHGSSFLVRNVDEFRDNAESSTEKRKEALKHAEKIVVEEVRGFINTWNHWSQGQLIAELYKNSQNYLAGEVDRIKEQFGVEENSKIEYVVKDVYAKMMHQLLDAIRGLDDSKAQKALEALNLAWRQTENSWQKPQKSPQLASLNQQRKP